MSFLQLMKRCIPKKVARPAQYRLWQLVRWLVMVSKVNIVEATGGLFVAWGDKMYHNTNCRIGVSRSRLVSSSLLTIRLSGLFPLIFMYALGQCLGRIREIWSAKQVKDRSIQWYVPTLHNTSFVDHWPSYRSNHILINAVSVLRVNQAERALSFQVYIRW